MSLIKILEKKILSVGERGEIIALEYLKSQGHKLLERNFFNHKGRRIGEIDMITEEAGEIVFIEVKTRTISGSNASLPEESITAKKLHKLSKISSFYLSKNCLLDAPYRFDAVTVLIDKDNNLVKVNHLKNIFL